MFEKGQSGNPSGRPRMPESLKTNLRNGADKAVQVWREILDDPEATRRDRIKAGELLVMYSYGKPLQPVDVDGSVRSIAVDTSKLSSEQQEAIIALALNSVDDSIPGPD